MYSGLLHCAAVGCYLHIVSGSFWVVLCCAAHSEWSLLGEPKLHLLHRARDTSGLRHQYHHHSLQSKSLKVLKAKG